jgi:hypothetical protein
MAALFIYEAMLGYLTGVSPTEGKLPQSQINFTAAVIVLKFIM